MKVLGSQETQQEISAGDKETERQIERGKGKKPRPYPGCTHNSGITT